VEICINLVVRVRTQPIAPHSNFSSGRLLSDMPLLNQALENGPSKQFDRSVRVPIKEDSNARSPGSIMLAHNRMFYTKPAMKRKRQVRIGLRHDRK
jgi:hypothetical protein